LKAQGKGGSTANAETIADIQKYEGKVQGALDAYSRQNAQVKDDMTEGKGKHDELVDELFIVTITCQVFLICLFTCRKLKSRQVIRRLNYSGVRQKLLKASLLNFPKRRCGSTTSDHITAQLRWPPPLQVALARERVEGLIGKGGVQIEPKPKSKLEKGN